MAINTENMIGTSYRLRNKGISWARTRFRYVPLLAYPGNGAEYQNTSVTTSSGPMRCAFDGQYMWAPCQNANAINKIDLNTGATLATYSPAASGTYYYQDACYAAGYLWFASASDTTIIRMDPITGATSVLSGYSIGWFQFDGSNVWASDSNGGALYKIDPNSLAVTTVSVTSDAHYMAFDGTNIWLSSLSANIVTPINVSTNAAGTNASVTGPTYGCFDGTSVWLASNSGGSISKIDPSTSSVTATVSLTSPYGLVFDGIQLWAANSSGITPIDISANTAGTTISYTGAVEMAFDGTHVWASDSTGSTVYKYLVRRY